MSTGQLIGIWTLVVIYALPQPDGSTDAAGRGTEFCIKGLCVFILFALAGLNCCSIIGVKSLR